MRTLLAGERTTIQASTVAHHLKVEVRNGSGTWKDYSSYVIGCSWGEDIDQPVGTASIQLRRKNGSGVSLAPLMTVSTLNVNDAAAYAPALDVGRLVRISTATLAPGAVPIAGDYREVFSGRVDTVAWESDPVSLECSDLGAWLMDTQIELLDQEYGTTPGTALETVIQNILNDTPSGVGAVPTLYTPTSPSYLVTTWTQGRVKVLEGVRNIAQQSTGWDVRFRYDSAHVSRLTLWNPDRSRVSVDATIGPTEYRDVRRLSLSIADIRNAGLVPYTDATGVQQVYSATDSSSIAKYGRRYFELPSNESIDTLGEATTLLTAVLHDLSGSPADQEIDLLYAWFVQLYDRYTFTQNGDHYDTDQTLAVVGYRHDFTGGQGITTIRTVDRVVGAYADWLRGISTQPTLTPQLSDIRRADTTTQATYTWTREQGVADVWAASATFATPHAEANWGTVLALLAPLGAGVDTYTATLPDDGEVTLIILQPYDWNLAAGPAIRITITATPQVPTWEYDDSETATIGTQWIRLTERGIDVSTVNAQFQLATTAFTTMATPTRGPGDASTVKGGTLAALEYEQDVPLSTTKGRQSFVRFEWLLVNGQTITSPDFAFDAGRAPTIISLTSAIAVVSGSGDSDVQSWKITNGGTWTRTIDGQFFTADVSLADDDGTTGLAANTTASYTVTAYNVAVADQGSATSDDLVAQTIVVYNGTGSGGSGGSPAATWLSVQAIAPSVLSDTLTIKLQATSAPVGWTTKVYLAEPSTATAVDQTASLSPSPTSPPTALTTYTYSTGQTRVSSGAHTTTYTLSVRAELRDGSSVVQDSDTVTASWTISSAL